MFGMDVTLSPDQSRNTVTMTFGLPSYRCQCPPRKLSYEQEFAAACRKVEMDAVANGLSSMLGRDWYYFGTGMSETHADPLLQKEDDSTHRYRARSKMPAVNIGTRAKSKCPR
jgi:hypothetical protein